MREIRTLRTMRRGLAFSTGIGKYGRLQVGFQRVQEKQVEVHLYRLVFLI